MEKMGTGYFSEDFRGRPRGRRVEASPKVVAILTCQSAASRAVPWEVGRIYLLRVRGVDRFL